MSRHTCKDTDKHVWHWNGDVIPPAAARCDCQKLTWEEREERNRGWHTKKLNPYQLNWESIWRYK